MYSPDTCLISHFTTSDSLVFTGINHRHRMAQLCGRASVNLHTLIFFRDKRVETDAVIMKVRSNGIVVLVPRYGEHIFLHSFVYILCAHGWCCWGLKLLRYGMESPIQFITKDDAACVTSGWSFNEEKQQLTGPGVTYQIFDRLRVCIYVQALKNHRYLHFCCFCVLRCVDPMPC
jgi:hypothetical protein